MTCMVALNRQRTKKIHLSRISHVRTPSNFISNLKVQGHKRSSCAEEIYQKLKNVDS